MDCFQPCEHYGPGVATLTLLLEFALISCRGGHLPAWDIIIVCEFAAIAI